MVMRTDRRIGLYLKKIGCTSVASKIDGRMRSVTLLQLEDTVIISKKTEERDGYSAAVLGYGDFRNIRRPQLGCLKRNGIVGRYRSFESRLMSLEGLEAGAKIDVRHFVVGQYVDVTGRTLGKGFAGVMKRHGFGGLRASHGVSLTHRSHGSTGQCQDPGRVWRGKKMAGRMGFDRVTVQNLRIVGIHEGERLVIVSGNSIPGHNGSYVFVRDAVKKSLPIGVSFPTVYVSESFVDTEATDGGVVS